MHKLLSMVVLITLTLSCSAPVFADETLSPKILEQIQSAVFEVVVPKPDNDALIKYQEPLPLNRIPFTVRNDKFFSIGTAFAIGPNTFVSAAHVVTMGTESLAGEPKLRDRSGKVYAIDQILKYSDRRDFIVFTAKECSVGLPLEINPTAQLNHRVYAVGNALGEGVVIRDGLYTSDTPEQEDGSWNWLRFSAAASPGNSGGPLLDGAGRVIGIILRKSPSENLNLALPIAEVTQHQELAHFHRSSYFALPIIEHKREMTQDNFYPLPRSFADLNRTLIERMILLQYVNTRTFLTDAGARLFPNGQGAKPFLAWGSNITFPAFIKMRDDGTWDTMPVTATPAELWKNGSIAYGEGDGYGIIVLRKPDSVSPEQLHSDGTLFMDLLLKGIKMTREIGDVPIRITSLGPPAESSTFSDCYGRIWLIKTWLRKFDDQKTVTFSLPTPEGTITLMKTAQSGRVDTVEIPTLKMLTNFMSVSYSGSLKEWKNFLSRKDLIPRPFLNLSVSEGDGCLSVSSPRLTFQVDRKVLPLTEESVLGINMGYYVDRGAVVWDANSLWVADDRSNGTVVSVSRYSKPDPELNRDFQSVWGKITREEFPYNRNVYSIEGTTRIMARVETKAVPTAGVLHSVMVSSKGTVSQRSMEKVLARVLDGIAKVEEAPDAGMSFAPVSFPFLKYSRMMQESATPVRIAYQGVARMLSGDAKGAQQRLDQAVSLDPQCSVAFQGKGALAILLQNADQAEKELTRALELNPVEPMTMVLLGGVKMERQQFDQAVALFQRALQINPKIPQIYLNLAKIHAVEKQFDIAIMDLGKAIEIEPYEAKNYYLRGEAYRMARDANSALADYDRALELNPSLADARVARGMVLEAKQAFAEADLEYATTLRLEPDHPQAHFSRGLRYLRKRAFSEAVADFEVVIKFLPQFPAAYMNRGLALSSQGEYGKAIADFSKVIELDPGSAEALVQRGYSYAHVGKTSEALADLDRAVAVAPGRWFALYARGFAHLAAGAPVKTLADLKLAEEMAPNQLDIFVLKGGALLMRKDPMSALAEFNRALAIEPKDMRAHRGRGQAYADLKEMPNACLDWKQACTLGGCAELIKAQKQGNCLGL
ncbi:tetratricopeptide repeat-containing S1 family peptidase [Geomesophilobacter sediminis]|uniref:Serine protease n=1 Tax=Geomesophilobacter sediminis TaxID=2798584 RepID=A0A8J7JJ88_9BACT|nr:serine protease [Geomesophilobacter sediminis]MBJ6724605.1 tetratricopeptide repeat protein [Geomesophilobacter sediminis]